MSMFTQGDDFYDMGYAKGFAAGQADANDMLTIAHMDGYSKGREATRRELEGQEAVAYGYPNTAITGKGAAMMMVRLDIPSDDQYGGAQWVPLYAAPPDVRELVGALERISGMKPHFAGQTPNEFRMQAIAASALAKHRGQS